jgi:hypothetical protein
LAVDRIKGQSSSNVSQQRSELGNIVSNVSRMSLYKKNGGAYNIKKEKSKKVKKSKRSQTKRKN